MPRKGKNRVRTRNGWRHDQRRGVIWFPVGNRAHELHILTLQCLQEGIPSGYCVAVGSCGSTTMQWQPFSSTLGIGAPIWGPTVCDMSKMLSAGTGTAQIIAAATAKAAVESPDGLSAAGAKVFLAHANTKPKGAALASGFEIRMGCLAAAALVPFVPGDRALVSGTT
jgi:hypothetical protein